MKYDVEELFHLALKRMENNDHEGAIEHLKNAVEIAPNHGGCLYLLGAEYAQIGMYDRAVEFFQKSIDCDPSLHTARFQLGLLKLTLNDVDGGTETLQPLTLLGETHYLNLFQQGLVAVAKGDKALGVAKLKEGIANNQENAALNKDMQGVINRNQDDDSDSNDTPSQEDNKQNKHLFVSSYNSEE